MAYQSFPWMPGSSKSIEKLCSLAIPNLEGKSFLDVGCNEGFFCGYAEFAGASNVTGIDINPDFLKMARILFPKCDFICEDWENLDDRTYDVILNTSAIHYASDQKKFIDMLMCRLKPGGVLILEIGIAPGNGNEFVEVKRSIDTRYFPTREKLREMLADYSYKFISHSVPQAGDPVHRQVYHISHKLPYAILFMDTPHAGKTFTIDNILKEDIKRISGDRLLHEIAAGSLSAPDGLTKIVDQNRERMDCGLITYQICKQGLFAELCGLISSLAMNEDFILDMYIPLSFRPSICQHMEKEGFYVVNMQLHKALSHPRAKEMAHRNSCQNYYEYLRGEFMIDEEQYLAANPDVAQALAEGKIYSALAHYIFHGRKEGRKRSPDDKGGLRQG